jgi:hypothetical protein
MGLPRVLTPDPTGLGMLLLPLLLPSCKSAAADADSGRLPA